MGNAYRAIVSAGGGAAVGDATAADVLTGKTFSGAVGSGVSGTMPNNGAVTQTLALGASYTIPAGYHNGEGVVTSSGITEIVDFYADNPNGNVSTDITLFTAAQSGVYDLLACIKGMSGATYTGGTFTVKQNGNQILSFSGADNRVVSVNATAGDTFTYTNIMGSVRPMLSVMLVK